MSNVGGLSDEDIQRIFRAIAIEKRPVQGHDTVTSQFLFCYASAVCFATRKDFMIMRPTSLVLIGKYNLGSCLEEAKSA